jgi:GldM C-terminal domain
MLTYSKTKLKMKKITLILGLLNSIFFALKAQDAVVEVAKMNVFYVGVDNPILIAVPNVANAQIKVTGGKGIESIKLSESGYYIVRVSRPGEAIIFIEANGKITEKRFRAKQIPDPIPLISGVRSGQGVGDKSILQNFIHAQGLAAKLENFDFGPLCSIQSFTIFIKSKKGELYQANLIGSSFTEEVKKRFSILEVGDVVNFLDIKARCSGDEIARSIGSLTYTIK